MPLVPPSVSVRVQHNFCFFWASNFGFVSCFLSWGHLPCICNNLQRYLLHFGMVTLHFSLYLLHLALAMFAFHCAWYLSYFGIPTFHLHGICFKRSCWFPEDCLDVNFGCHLRFHVGFHAVFLRVSVVVSLRVSFRVSLAFHLGFHLWFPYGFI